MTENTTPFDKANLATVMETLKNYSVDYSHLGEDYIISRISAVKPQFKRKLMGRFNGMTVLVSVRGTLHLTLNMESVVVKPNSAVFILSASGEGRRRGTGVFYAFSVEPLHAWHQLRYECRQHFAAGVK